MIQVAGFDLEGNNLTGLQQSYINKLRFYKIDVTKEVEVTDSVKKVIDIWRLEYETLSDIWCRLLA